MTTLPAPRHDQDPTPSPLIDIMMPFWGDPQLLHCAVESVLNQSDCRWRLTVIDDAYPADQTRYFREIDDHRVTYLRNDTNVGIIENFRKCQRLAEAPYTMIMGCDDRLLPDFISKSLEIALAHPADIYQCGVAPIDENGLPSLSLADRVKRMIRPRSRQTANLRGDSLEASLLTGDWLYWPSLVFKTNTLKRAEFPDEFNIILDLSLILDLIESGASMVAYPEIVFEYRRHSDSLSSTALLSGNRFQDEKQFFKMRAKTAQSLGWPLSHIAARSHLTSRAYALTLIPSALKARQSPIPLLRHAFL